ncbi:MULTISPECIES: ribosome maturation factor RimP [Shouchella]|uniref:Ribosome maturation factor RimP n=3 Tax=Bacillaceae TaxID=186817 RepID=A0A060LX70_9BACI|nr:MULTISPECIES: ribosome maturation factor RimP [Bacillaceae]RQW20645.1 ribosome maturation factor RimP [Bacillus sp. C1-1]AIC94797.1 ribosome maturation factor rimP [Shouchella lehensis G1]KQL58666.1 ribosome maturation factor RimP [Alkalicoccobacillus plakortidis]MBG9784343.1 ribosome maturation factor RimP [Shouchella lehensis]TES50664.1 ribosome maturation factor RimP [Shouchella lehensis]
MSKIVSSKVEQLVLPIVDDLQLELVEVEYKKEGPNWFLRVYIDSDKGVDLDDCEKVSEKLSEQLDEADPIKEAYFLEVSSPGAERPLKKKADVEKAVGKGVYITTYEPLNGEKTFEGKLQAFEDNQLTVDTKVKTRTVTYTIPYDKIANIRLSILF